MDVFLLSSSSIVQKIENSHIFKDEFQKKASEMEDALQTQVRNLRAAKHRFESYSKPLGRLVLWCDAVIATAETISIKRKGQAEGTAANEFLKEINEEKLLQLAMMADAADEVSGLLRHVDTETYDSAVVPELLQQFVSGCVLLFKEGKCMEWLGYTSYIVARLKRTRLLFLADGSSRTLGGPDCPAQPVVQRCLERMTCWVKLAINVIQTEWPSWEVLAAFGSFELTKTIAGRGSEPDRAGLRKDLQKMAKAFSLNAGKLEDELFALRPVAQKIFKATGCSTLEAWQKAVARVSERTDQAKKYLASKQLLKALVRFSVYGGSTSGVEQNFAAKLRVLSHREDMTGQRDTCLMKVALERRPEEESHVIGVAQEIWAEHFGHARESPKEARLDKDRKVLDVDGPSGSTEKSKHNSSEAAFLRARRGAVKEGVAKRGLAMSMQDIDTAEVPGWMPSHEKERQFQVQKRRKLMVGAFKDGHLVDEEITAEVEEDAARADKRADELAKERSAKDRLDTEKLSSKKYRVADMQGKKIFVDGKCPQQDACKAAAGAHLLQCVQDRLQADIFVVPQIADPPQRTEWACAIVGGLLTVPAFIKGEEAPAIKYAQACRLKRDIDFAEHFQADHPSIHALIADAFGIPESNWRAKKGANTITLIGKTDKAPEKQTQSSTPDLLANCKLCQSIIG